MEGKVKKAVGVTLLVCIALTGLGLAAQPAAALDFSEDTYAAEDAGWDFGDLNSYEYGFDDPCTQTCRLIDDAMDEFDFSR